MNVCSPCGQDFSSVEAFDRHRVGEHAYSLDEGLLLDSPREDGRRCLSLEEMATTGWAVDARGRWVHPRELRKRIRRGGDRPSAATTTASATPRSPRKPTDRSERITAPGGES